MTQQTLKAMRAAFHMTKQRCLNPTCRDYPYYGGRGISICKRWLDSFENFVADMGLRPPGHTLERRDNNKGYSKGNCYWATRAQQSSNTRVSKSITYKGKTDTLSGWARHLGVEVRTLSARLRVGYSVEQAFTKPVKCGARLEGRKYAPRPKPDMSRIPRGLDSPQTKLTRKQVLEMRRAALKGKSFSSLARRFNVTVTTASNAVQQKGAYQNV